MLAVTGEFPGQVTLVPSSLSTILLGTGAIEEEKRFVLVPYLDMRISGKRQRDLPQEFDPESLDLLFGGILPLENALWLTFDIVRDTRLALSRLNDMAGNSLALESARLAHARNYAQRLAIQANLCADILGELVQKSAAHEPAESAETDDVRPARPTRRVVPRKPRSS
jgi:hypothetical protein